MEQSDSLHLKPGDRVWVERIGTLGTIVSSAGSHAACSHPDQRLWIVQLDYCGGRATVQESWLIPVIPIKSVKAPYIQLVVDNTEDDDTLPSEVTT